MYIKHSMVIKKGLLPRQQQKITIGENNINFLIEAKT